MQTRFRPSASARKLTRPFPYTNMLQHLNLNPQNKHQMQSLRAIRLANDILASWQANCDNTELIFGQSGRKISLLRKRLIGLEK
jgi:hypothetical protein